MRNLGPPRHVEPWNSEEEHGPLDASGNAMDMDMDTVVAHAGAANVLQMTTDMPPQRVCIFDFDETLAVGTAYPGAPLDELFGGERLRDLIVLLEDITSAGVLLAIVSFNMKEVLAPIVEAAGLSRFFPDTLIFGREVFETDGALRRQPFFWKKSSVIRELIMPVARLHSPRGDSVLFIDDDPANVQDVTQNLFGSQCVLVPGNGLRDFAAVRRWLASAAAEASASSVFDAPAPAPAPTPFERV